MTEQSTEHRRNFRPPTPMAGLMIRLDTFMEEVAKSKTWNMVTHAIIMGFTLICIATIWWSISLRLPQLENDDAELYQLNQMDTQLEKFRLHTNSVSSRNLTNSIQAHEKHLFTNKKAVVLWLKQQINLAEQQGIRLHYELGKIRSALEQHHEMDITFQFTLVSASDLTQTSEPHNNYARLIHFIEHMHYHGIPPHIRKISLKGSERGLSSVALQATIWLR